MRTGPAARALLPLFLLALLLAACSGNRADRTTEPAGHLKVAYVDAAAFMANYGDRIQRRFPDVHIEVVAVPPDKLGDPDAYARFLADSKVDLIAIHDYALFGALERGETLLDLKPLAERDGYELEAFQPALLSLWQDSASGALYGMAPSFQLDGLFLNADAFARQGVPAPSGTVSWDSLFDTAVRFKPEKGFQPFMRPGVDTPLDWLLELAASEGMKLIASDGKTLLLDTPGWRGAFHTVVAGYRKGALLPDTPPAADPANPLEAGADPFAGGHAAIYAASLGYAATLPSGGIAWQALPAPVLDPGRKSAAVRFPVLFGIKRDSAAQQLAWEVVQYVNGEEWAAAAAKTSPDFSTHGELIRNVGMLDVHALLEGEVRPWSIAGLLPADVQRQLDPAVTGAVKAVLDGTLTEEAALEQIRLAFALLTIAR